MSPSDADTTPTFAVTEFEFPNLLHSLSYALSIEQFLSCIFNVSPIYLRSIDHCAWTAWSAQYSSAWASRIFYYFYPGSE